MLHPSLPQAITTEQLAQWLVSNSKESYHEEKKFYYSDDDLSNMKDQAMKIGIEIKNLNRLKKKVTDMITKGSEEDITIDVPGGMGIKNLKSKRDYLEEQVDQGYYKEVIKIYGIPNQETRCMDYFDIEGNEIPDRCRPLSTKEVRDYIAQYNLPLESKQA